MEQAKEKNHIFEWDLKTNKWSIAFMTSMWTHCQPWGRHELKQMPQVTQRTYLLCPFSWHEISPHSCPTLRIQSKVWEKRMRKTSISKEPGAWFLCHLVKILFWDELVASFWNTFLRMFGHSKWEGLQNISILSVSRPKGLACCSSRQKNG